MSSFLFVSVLLLTPLQISASAYASTSGDCETGACTPQIDDTIAMIQSKTKVILDAQMSKEDTMSLTKSSVVGVSLQEDGQNKLVATQKMEKAMQTAVEEMVTNGRGSSIPSSVLDSIVAEMEAMAANLVKEHANFQQQIYDASTVVKNCNTNKETTAGPGGSVAEAKGSMEERNTTHDTCRTAEQIAYNDKNSTCTVMAQMSDASCKAAPKCTCETNPECDVVSVLACFEEHSRWIASGAESLKAQKVDCDAKTTSWSSKADECDTDQENYEIAFCSYAEQVDTMCSTLETCYAQALAAHESTDLQVKDEEKELKILMASAKKIVCFLSVIQKGSSGNVTMSDYEVCKNLNVSSDKTYLNKSTEDMVITYEPADQQAACEPIINTPGDGPWAAKEYAKYNQDWLRETAVCVHKTTTTTEAATDAAQCSASDVGYNWDLVRRTTSNTFPDTDQLEGSSVYGTRHDNPLGASFAKAYDASDFNEFLFTTGDCSRWMIMRRSEVLAWYSDETREILASHTSSNPYSARMFRRAGNLEDPWITFSDHGSGIDAHCNALYQENNFDPYCTSGDLGTLYQGLNVFIRKATTTTTTAACNVANCDECHVGWTNSCRVCSSDYHPYSVGGLWACETCATMSCSTFSTEWGCNNGNTKCNNIRCHWQDGVCKKATTTTTTQALPMIWYDVSDGWSLSNTYAQAVAFCSTKLKRLCSRDEYCPSGSVSGGTKSGDFWAPYSGDDDNAWLQVGVWPGGSATCVAHHELPPPSNVRPSWGSSTTAHSFRQGVACCEATTTTTTQAAVSQLEANGQSFSGNVWTGVEWNFDTGAPPVADGISVSGTEIHFAKTGIYRVTLSYRPGSSHDAWTAARLFGTNGVSVGHSAGHGVQGPYDPDLITAVLLAEIADTSVAYELQIGRDTHALSINSPAEIAGELTPGLQASIVQAMRECAQLEANGQSFQGNAWTPIDWNFDAGVGATPIAKGIRVEGTQIHFTETGTYQVTLSYRPGSSHDAWTAARLFGKNGGVVGHSAGHGMQGSYDPDLITTVFLAEVGDTSFAYELQIGRHTHALNVNSPAKLVGELTPGLQATIVRWATGHAQLEANGQSFPGHKWTPVNWNFGAGATPIADRIKVSGTEIYFTETGIYEVTLSYRPGSSHDAWTAARLFGNDGVSVGHSAGHGMKGPYDPQLITNVFIAEVADTSVVYQLQIGRHTHALNAQVTPAEIAGELTPGLQATIVCVKAR